MLIQYFSCFSHIFEVQWSAPSKEGLNGALAGFQLVCELILEQQIDVLLNMSVSPNVTSQKVRLPLTKGRVSIKVAARTSRGIGVFSEAYSVAIGNVSTMHIKHQSILLLFLILFASIYERI